MLAHDEVCARCGRDATPHVDIPAHYRQPRMGEDVRLSAEYRQFHDAKYGPLKEKQVGKVVEVGPRIPQMGARFLVRCPEAMGDCSQGEGDTWWYDEGAIQAVEDFVQDRISEGVELGGEEHRPGVLAMSDTATEASAAALAADLQRLLARARHYKIGDGKSRVWCTRLANFAEKMLLTVPGEDVASTQSYASSSKIEDSGRDMAPASPLQGDTDELQQCIPGEIASFRT